MSAQQSNGVNLAIEPYLFFGGRCEEALNFYKDTLGATIDYMMRFHESPEPPPPGVVPDGFENKIMHSLIRIRGTALMASDGCDPSVGFNGFSLCMTMPSDNEAHRVFDLLSEGGSVRMPLSKTFWSPCYGMLTDRFGIAWMVMVPGEM